MSQRPSGCRSCLNQNTFRNTHSWLSTPSLSAKEQMLCNFLFSPETVASTPCLTRPLSPALHWWSLAGKNAVGPPSRSHTTLTPSIITLRNASLPHKCKQRLVWIPACLFLWIMSLCNGGAVLCTYCLILSTDPFSLCAWEIPFQSHKSLFWKCRVVDAATGLFSHYPAIFHNVKNSKYVEEEEKMTTMGVKL